MKAWPVNFWSRRGFLEGLGITAAAASLSGAAGEAVAQAEANEGVRRFGISPEAGLEGIRQLLAGEGPLTWVFTGDSITHGALHTLGWRSYSEHFAERVRWELKRMRDVVINTGISGDRTGGILADLDWRALRFQPDVVSAMFGMNDCTAGPDGRETFRRNLDALIDRILAAGAIPIVNSPNTVYRANSGGRDDLPAYAEITREVATRRKLAFVDHWAHWEQAKADQEQLLAWLEDRRIHPGVYGHREFAKLLFRELGIYDDASPTCTLEVP